MTRTTLEFGEKHYLNGTVQTHGGEARGVLRVEAHRHDVVHVSLEFLSIAFAHKNYAHQGEVVVPVPHLDQHVVAARQNVGERLVHVQSADEVVVRHPLLHLFVNREEDAHLLSRVVVVHAHFHVVTAKHDPLLPGNEAAATDGLIAGLEVVPDFLLLRVENDRLSREEAEKRPGLGGVVIDALHAVALLQILKLGCERRGRRRHLNVDILRK